MNRLPIGLLMWVAFSPITAADTDPIKVELDKARVVYTKRAEAAKEKLLLAIDNKLKEVAGKGDLDGVKDIKTQKDLFHKDGKLPSGAYLGRAKSDYDDDMRGARETLRKALEKAKIEYTKALKIEEADAIAAELKQLAAAMQADRESIDSAKGLPKGAKPRSEEDQNQGTWEGVLVTQTPRRSTHDVILRVIERDGITFKGQLESDNGQGLWHVEGTIKGSAVQFRLTKRVRGRDDVVGVQQFSGSIKGRIMNLAWAIRGTTESGIVELKKRDGR
jgi:hypothetical protein